jgi:hypothetical protein
MLVGIREKQGEPHWEMGITDGAQHAAVADAATRPQDRCVFAGQTQSNGIPIYRWRRS